MNIKNTIILIVLFVLIVSTFNASAQDNIPVNLKDSVVLREDVRGLRYCEILVVKGRFRKLKVTVYNTFGSNDCPADKWNKIDFKKVKKDFKAKAVIKNGPRYWLMDKLGKAIPKNGVAELQANRILTNFQGLEMSNVATVKIKKKIKPYKETTVNRSTVYVFNKGSLTYQLTSPTATYVMQAYSQTVDNDLQETDLDRLANRLKLPKDWSYKAVKLDADLELKTFDTKKATVIQDDLQNTYQRIN